MKTLQTATAILEAGTGVALLGFPSAVVTLLLGSGLDEPAAVILGRLAGAALLTLGIACWFVRADAQSRAARGLVSAMFGYNFVAVAILGFAGFSLHLRGIALWPAVVIHALMAAWCIGELRRLPPAKPGEAPT